MAVSRYDAYDSAAKEILRQAQRRARMRGASSLSADDLIWGAVVGSRELLQGLVADSGLQLDMERIDREIEAMEAAFAREQKRGRSLSLDREVREIFSRAESLAERSGGLVGPLHLLHAMRSSLGRKLPEFVVVGDTRERPDTPVDLDLPPIPEADRSLKDIARQLAGESGLEIPRDITSFVWPLPRPHPRPAVLGREREIESLVRILLSRFKPNALLLGDPGVGKTALVEELAARIASGSVPLALRGAKVFEVSASSLIGGTGMHGALEDRVRKLVEFLEQTPGAILFLDEIHALIRPTSSGNPLDLLKPALARGRFRCIAATTQAEYYQHLASDEAFTRRFLPLVLTEPSREATCTILKSVMQTLEKHHRRRMAPGLADRVYSLAERLLPQRFFPDKGIDLLDRAFALTVARGGSDVTAAEIDEAAAEMAGLPADELLPGSSGRLELLEESLASRIIGQDRAVQAVANVVRLCKQRLDIRPERPDGVILLAGPTGVGKTALAEALAEALTGSLKHLVRINMGQFSESHTISQLIGSPPGYVGYSDEPLLVRAATRHPHGVILLDEIEKAHPEVLRFFLELFETGRFSDRLGRRHTLSNATIVATCNLTPEHRTAVGFGERGDGQGETASALLPELAELLPIELMNRFDEVVVLDPIGHATALEILRRVVVPEAAARLEAEHGVKLLLDPSAEEVLLQRGYSEAMGVRELHRAFQDLVLSPLARLVPELECPVTVTVAAEPDGTITINAGLRGEQRHGPGGEAGSRGSG